MTVPALGRAVREAWLLEPGIAFLNHGSYGATPRVVLAAQQAWRDRMEAQPVRFMTDLLTGGLLRDAAAALGRFLGVPSDGLAFVENATAGINAVLRSFPWQRGDRVVTTDHVYGAVRNTLTYLAETAGIELVVVAVPCPVAGPEEMTARLAAAIGHGACMVLVDHVASPSALILPIDRIAALARAAGAAVLIDGAHAPGMLDLDLSAIDADWYVGNCHKWLCAPKGAGFLWAAPTRRESLHPTVISHGLGHGMAAEFDWVGTRDPTAWLAVPDAIAFHERLGGASLRARNHDLAMAAGSRLAIALGTALTGPPAMLGSMAAIRLPTRGPATRELATEINLRLWQEHRIEVPVTVLGDRLWLRLSAQAYNDADDYAGLPDALATILG